ncbi:MAG: APC family permease [Coriobacteriia bacterium]|nr:APC family permease [Coriobacteriia bacterium]
MSDSGSETKLARNAIGLADVLFQSITSMAPAAAIAASIPLGAAFAAGALPLAVLIAFIGILFTAWAIGQLATHIPAAGSVATYTAVGLSPKLGFLVGWAYAAVEVLIVPLVMLQLGFTLAGELTGIVPGISAGSWWIFMAIGTILVCWLVYLGVKTSTETGVWLGAIEIAVFLVLGIVLVVKAGSANTLLVFTPHFANAKGFTGWSGVFAGAVGALLAFSGFEAAAPLAEETKNPRRNIPLAIMGATVAIGILYIFTTYAAVVSFGPSNFAGFATWNNGVPWDGLAKDVSIVFWALVLFAIVNSTLANANSGANVFTRTAYAMGRIGVFPRAFANLHPKHKSPQFGVLVELVLGLALALVLGFWTTPVVAFGIIATALVVIVVPVYMLANLACVGFFARHRKEEQHWFSHIVIPIAGLLFLIPGFLSVAGITGIPGLGFIAALTAPYSYAPWVMLVWMIIGVVVLFVMQSRNPKAIDAVAHIHLDEEIAA